MGSRSQCISPFKQFVIWGSLVSVSWCVIIFCFSKPYQEYKERQAAKKELEEYLDYLKNSA